MATKSKIRLEFRSARLTDIDSLLKLYFDVYGNSYPLALGTDRKKMAEIINNKNNRWLVAASSERILGSLVFEVDPIFKIARAEGLAIHPEMRKGGIAQELLHHGTEALLHGKKAVSSIYCTTRTLSKGPQLVFLRDGYKALGIFPNAHRLNQFETLTLMAKFNPDALKRRVNVDVVPEAIAPLVSLVNKTLKVRDQFKIEKYKQLETKGKELVFEIIDAPEYVLRIFNERYKNPYDRFYPFHEPNLLLSSTDGEVEIFAHHTADGYCTIVALNKACWELAGRLRPLLHKLRGFGISYLEILMGLQHTKSLQSLLGAQFLPSAIYPAMYNVKGECHDMVLMTRTMEPLNFRGMEVAASFKPYIDQYVNLWKKMYLDVVETFNE